MDGADLLPCNRTFKFTGFSRISYLDFVVSQQLAKIVDYIDQLQKVDTKNVEPTYNVTGLKSVFREDKSSDSLEQKAALQNAKEQKQGYFVTKGVFEQE